MKKLPLEHLVITPETMATAPLLVCRSWGPVTLARNEDNPDKARRLWGEAVADAVRINGDPDANIADMARRAAEEGPGSVPYSMLAGALMAKYGVEDATEMVNTFCDRVGMAAVPSVVAWEDAATVRKELDLRVVKLEIVAHPSPLANFRDVRVMAFWEEYRGCGEETTPARSAQCTYKANCILDEILADNKGE